jgi:3-oxoacyl-[acyl-carrier protein] reductase
VDNAKVIKTDVLANNGVIHVIDTVMLPPKDIVAVASSSGSFKTLVTAIKAAGLTRTPLTASLTQNELTLKASAALHPLGRIGEPGDVASAIRWFLSPEQSWVTGQVLAVDGGLSSLQSRMASNP